MFDYVIRVFRKLGLLFDGVSLIDLLVLNIICLEKKLVVVYEYVLKCSVFFYFFVEDVLYVIVFFCIIFFLGVE